MPSASEAGYAGLRRPRIICSSNSGRIRSCRLAAGRCRGSRQN